jgi:hypothetical protein
VTSVRLKVHTRAVPWNDAERAIRFAEVIREDYHNVHEWKRWYNWNNVRWVPDTDGAIIREAQKMFPPLSDGSRTIEGEDVQKKARSNATSAGNSRSLK